MKKIMNKINMAVIGMMVASPAFSVETRKAVDPSGICDLVSEMGSVFKMLRVFCFIGAAFMIAGWAWGYISKGEAKMDDLKKQGTALIVGFILLFAVGLIFSFLVGVSNGNWGLCSQELRTAFD